MAIHLREVLDSDWPAIAELAGVAVAGLEGVGPQDEWVANRRRFAGEGFREVAEAHGRIVGYVGAERDPSTEVPTFHLFMVLDWTEPDVVAPLLFDALTAYLQRTGAEAGWFREYAHDEAFLAFLLPRGFTAGEPYTIQGEEIVNLTWRRDGADAG